MPDQADGLSAEVVQRLQREEIIWFTTVSPRGVPVPNPVWFYWDGEYILVYSEPTSFRVRNIQNNPHVAITLLGVDAEGNSTAKEEPKEQLYEIGEGILHADIEKEVVKMSIGEIALGTFRLRSRR